MSRTLPIALPSALPIVLPLIAVGLATGCGSQVADAPEPERVQVVESPPTTCPPAPDIVLRKWVRADCDRVREARSGHPNPSG